MLSKLCNDPLCLAGLLRDWQVNGGELPPHVLPFCAVGGAAAALLAIATFLLQRTSQQMSEAPAIQTPESAERWRARRAAALAAAEWAIPSGIGMAVGMYVAAEWTLPRVIGCLAEQVRRRLRRTSLCMFVCACSQRTAWPSAAAHRLLGSIGRPSGQSCMCLACA